MLAQYGKTPVSHLSGNVQASFCQRDKAVFFSHAGLPVITLDVKNLGYIWQVSDMSGRFSLACSEVCFIPRDKVTTPVPVQINSLVVTVL